MLQNNSQYYTVNISNQSKHLSKLNDKAKSLQYIGEKIIWLRIDIEYFH